MMCYKEKKHAYINVLMSERLHDVPNFIADFFDQYKSAATKNCNWVYIRNLLQWLIDNKYIEKSNISDITKDDMNKITGNHIVKYLNDLKSGISGKKNSIDSVGTKKNVFSAFWNYMFINHYVTDNIVLHIPSHLYKSEITQKEVKVPTDKQLENFLRNINDGNSNEFNIIRNIAIVKLMLGSGIRSEELINLDMNDLFLDEEVPYMMILGKGKIEQYDKVFVSKIAKTYMDDYLVQRQMFVRDNDINNNAVFLSNDKSRMSKSSITSFFKRYSNGEINPHMLRHWVGTKLYEQTNDIVLVQKQLRHSSLETTAKYYVHTAESKIADAMADL